MANPPSSPPQAKVAIRRGFVEVGTRQVHYRSCGAGPAVVLLHDSPRSSRLHVPTMRALAERFTVYAPDTPGYGNSDPLALADPRIEDFAAALQATLAALGLEQAPLYATHTGAKIALALVDLGGRPQRLLLDGLSMPDRLADPDFITAYMRPFLPDAAGAYLGAEWSRIRDMLRWFPWFARSPGQRIAMTAPDSGWMAEYGIDLFCAGRHYADAYAAAMRYDPAPALARSAVPTQVVARSDDVLHGYLAKAAACGNPLVTTRSLPADRGPWLEWLVGGLAGTGAPAQSPSPAPSLPRGLPLPSARRRYVDCPHGQLHLTRHGAATGTPCLVLSAPTTLHAHAWATHLAAHRPALVPDLPGFGESDPLPEASAAAIADTLVVALDAMALSTVPLLGIGVAAPLATALARRHPQRVSMLVLDGMPPGDTALAGRFADGLCPSPGFDRFAGTHLHRIWHVLRDGEAQWPWHDETPGATRRLPPLFDADLLHAALTGVLKQPAHWGQAAQAALAAAEPGRDPPPVPALIFRHADPAYADAGALAGIWQARFLPRPDSLAEAAALLAPALPETA